MQVTDEMKAAADKFFDIRVPASMTIPTVSPYDAFMGGYTAALSKAEPVGVGDDFLYRLVENAFSWGKQDCNYLNPKHMDRFIASTRNGMPPEAAAAWVADGSNAKRLPQRELEVEGDDLIERVAKAIYKADDVWSEAFPWPTMGSKEQSADNYRRIARAAIAAVSVASGDRASLSLPCKENGETVTPSQHVELPADIMESLLAIGKVEWGVSLTQSDDKHASDLLDTLRITRECFGVTEEETGIHGVYLEGTGTVLAHTGMSPNSPQHARILAGAWNQLVDIAKARAAATEADHG